MLTSCPRSFPPTIGFFLACLLLGSVSASAADEADAVSRMTEGVFAVRLARTMNLQGNLPPAPLAADCIKLLEQLGIAPLTGWDTNRELTRLNYAVIMGMVAGKETAIHAEVQKTCDQTARLIDLRFIQQQHVAPNTVDSVNDLLANRTVFPAGQPVCPYGLPYEDQDNDGRIDRHDHSARRLLLPTEERAAGEAVPAAVPAPATTPVPPARPPAPVRESPLAVVRVRSGASAAPVSSPRPEPLHQWGRFLTLSAGIAQEYDNNIFNEEINPDWDHKTILTPAASFRRQFDSRTYAGLNYRAEAAHYYQHSAWDILQRVGGQLTLTPDPRWAFGVRNAYSHEGQSQVPDGTGGDRILALGYDINTLLVQGKVQLSERVALTGDYQYDDINFTDHAADTSIDRKVNLGRATFDYALTPRTTARAGYGYRDADYRSTAADSNEFHSHLAMIGLEHSFPGWCRVEVALEEEWRDFDLGNDDRRLNVRAGITSSFSRFTSAGVRYIRALGDSSRADYRQYESDRVLANLRYHFNPRTSVSLGGSYEHQRYRDGDKNLLGLVSAQKDTRLYSGDLILRRTLTYWLSGTLGYTYARKNTEFTLAGYTTHRGSLGLTAAW